MYFLKVGLQSVSDNVLIYEIGHSIESLLDLKSIFEGTADPAFEKPLSE
jgi:hypothetical protein